MDDSYTLVIGTPQLLLPLDDGPAAPTAAPADVAAIARRLGQDPATLRAAIARMQAERDARNR